MANSGIPLEALDAHIAIVGKTGSGKSYVGRLAVEQLLHAQRQVVVLDPTDAWYGLRTAADGKGPGFPVPILGGDHGDLPLPENTGVALAAHLVQTRGSAVVVTSHFNGAQRRRFYTAFLSRLYATNRTALYLVVDEADALAPQRPMPDQTMMLHLMDEIVRRGRVKGFRVMMITQRPAVLAKDVLSQAGCLVALKLTAPQDRNAIGAWIEGQADKDAAKQLLAALPSLPLGEGFVWWPERDAQPQRTRFPKIITFDSSRTPAPGEAAPLATRSATVDLSALADLLKAPAPAPAEAKPAKGKPAGHPAALAAAHARIAELDAQLQAATATVALQDALLAQLRHLLGQAPQEAAQAPPAQPVPAVGGRGTLAVAPGVYSGIQAGGAKGRAQRQDRPAAPDGVHPAAAPLLAELIALYPTRLTWATLAMLAGRKARGGHFNAARKALRDAGLVVEEGDLVSAAATAIGLPKQRRRTRPSCA